MRLCCSAVSRGVRSGLSPHPLLAAGQGTQQRHKSRQSLVQNTATRCCSYAASQLQLPIRNAGRSGRLRCNALLGGLDTTDGNRLRGVDFLSILGFVV